MQQSRFQALQPFRLVCFGYGRRDKSEQISGANLIPSKVGYQMASFKRAAKK